MALTSINHSRPRHRQELILFALAFLFLAGAALALIIARAARMGVWSAGSLRWEQLLLLPAWIASALLARWQAQRHLPDRDPILLPLGFLLAGWGTLTIWRLLPTFGLRQTGWLFAGTLLLILIIRQETELDWLRRYRYVWLLAGLLLTALTLFFGTHPSGAEPRLWLGWRGFYIQPSEFLRLLLIAYFASFLADRVSVAWDQEPPSLRGVLTPLIVVWSLSIGLLFVQRDLGTGTLFMGLLAVLLYLTTGRREIILVGGLMILVAGLAAWLTFGVVQARLSAWLNPWADPIGVGYQIIQASMSLAAGGLLGQGIGLGAPGFVPAAHTDFIFSSIVEEWGLLGGLALIAGLALLVQRGLRVARAQATTFPLILAAGLSVGMGLQVLLILGGVLRLLPLTGVTVPFVSYGGSSLVTSFASLALLLKISNSEGGEHQYRPMLAKLSTGWLFGVASLALALGWWTVVRAPDLRARTDNPRRALAERFSPRGAIFDRSGTLLAGNLGEPGELSRYYPQASAAPVVGFSSERYGQAGIESDLDPLLRGESGYPVWSIWWHRLLRASPPPGYDIRLSISLPLQEALMKSLENRIGAAVLLDGASGEVLALASSPYFDPNQFDETWSALTVDPDSPLLNRATQSRYQPGVALAPLLYAWSLEEEQALPAEISDFSANIPVDGQELGCAWPVEEKQSGSLELALQLGCPAPWGDLAASLGSSSIEDFISSFGLNREIAIPLIQSNPWEGEVPSESDGRAAFGYGQGDLTLNPLQLARAYGSLINGGQLLGVSLIDAVRSPEGDWTAFPGANPTSQPAVGAASARQTVTALTEQQPLEFTAEAVAGDAGQRLGWYVAAASDHPNQPLLVIVLEGEPGRAARAIGLGFLERAEEQLP